MPNTRLSQNYVRQRAVLAQYTTIHDLLSAGFNSASLSSGAAEAASAEIQWVGFSGL